jgi:hypothetical protein
MPDSSTFAFELSFELTEDEYVRRESEFLSRRSWRSDIAKALLTVLGIACLFRSSTIPIAILLLGAAVAAWTSPIWYRSTQRDWYRKRLYLHGLISCGVSERGIWFKGGALTVESGWDGVTVWGEAHNDLWIAAFGMPTIYLPIAELQKRNLYDRVRSLAERSGVEFNSPSARRGLGAPAV